MDGRVNHVTMTQLSFAARGRFLVEFTNQKRHHNRPTRQNAGGMASGHRSDCWAICKSQKEMAPLMVVREAGWPPQIPLADTTINTATSNCSLRLMWT